MSGAEKVDSFNPLLIVIWATQLILLGWDWSQDGQVRWSIPIIGSFFLVQVYMVWKTNYEKMMAEQRDAQARALGGPVDTPMIDPSSANLKEMYKSPRVEKSSKDQAMVNINQKKTNSSEE